jgi:Arm DNA-binding domain
MPKAAVPLTNIQVEEAVAADKPFKLFDGRGLYLLVAPKKSSGTTSKCWRFKYRFQDREKLLALGTYPEVSLVEARVRCEHARQLLAKRQNPGETFREEKIKEKVRASQTAADPGPSVSLNMDGDVVIRKGRSTLHLTEDEAQFVAELLQKLR